MKHSFTCFFVVVIFALGSCTYDDQESFYQECDTIDISFSEDVYAIIESRCISCHSSAFAQGGIELDDHNKIKDVAESGFLLGVIKHLPGYEPMPRGQNKLDDCSINKIETWINKGMPNN